jgi:hypothetical protein
LKNKERTVFTPALLLGASSEALSYLKPDRLATYVNNRFQRLFAEFDQQCGKGIK